jgi:hypothetical protein
VRKRGAQARKEFLRKNELVPKLEKPLDCISDRKNDMDTFLLVRNVLESSRTAIPSKTWSNDIPCAQLVRKVFLAHPKFAQETPLFMLKAGVDPDIVTLTRGTIWASN